MEKRKKTIMEEIYGDIIENTFHQTQCLYHLGVAQGMLAVRNIISSFKKDGRNDDEVLQWIDQIINEQGSPDIRDYYIQLKDEK